MARINYDFEKTILGQYNTARNRVLTEKIEDASNFFKQQRYELDEAIANKEAQFKDRQMKSMDYTDEAVQAGTQFTRAQTKGEGIDQDFDLLRLKEMRKNLDLRDQALEATGSAMGEMSLTPLDELIRKRGEGRKDLYLSGQDRREITMGAAKSSMTEIGTALEGINQWLKDYEAKGLHKNPSSRAAYEQMANKLAKLQGMANEAQKTYVDTKMEYREKSYLGIPKAILPGGFDRAYMSKALKGDAFATKMDEQISQINGLRESIQTYTAQMPNLTGGPSAPYTEAGQTGDIVQGPYRTQRTYPTSLNAQTNR